MNILVLNGGSSSLKYRLFRAGKEVEEVIASGIEECASRSELLGAARKVIEACLPHGIDIVAQRIVHGGGLFWEETVVTDEVVSKLRTLRELNPLHNPEEVAILELSRKLLPKIPCIAVFDTAFHRSLPEVAYRYAIPPEVSDELQLRRYGFHGLSHQYVSGKILECLNRAAQGTRLVTCHLGNGASVCAVQNGKSVETSMGLTPLEGLVMGTRSGDIDPGLLLYLLRIEHLTPKRLDDLLNHQSGLKGVSGVSADVRELEAAAANGDKHSTLALDLFAYRVRKYIGAYAAVMGGLDAVAFCGGIGEHAPSIRAKSCAGLGFLGVHLDSERNTGANGSKPSRISKDHSPVAVWVIPTDEELQIAQNVLANLPAIQSIAPNGRKAGQSAAGP